MAKAAKTKPVLTFTVTVNEKDTHEPAYVLLEALARDMRSRFGPGTKVTLDD